IVYLLRAGERSHWHRIDATETWHHYGGDPLELLLWPGAGRPERHVLGHDVAGGQEPFVIVPPGVWQAAATLGTYTFAGCTVTPGFVFEGFELAAPGWEPPPSTDDGN
ncbi:MAG: cupin domain-containing protein, partial [Acidimicrobiales bacterium]|nr:cupin domain-containing protein [Acidimicrobiales bacterium]